MAPILLLWMTLAFVAPEPLWSDLAFTIVRDPETSSDTVTLCRVRVVNNGSHTWPGRQIRFEATALEGGTIVERTHGRFGLSLGPHQTLETLIGFSGRYDRFEVRPLPKGSRQPDEQRRGRRPGSRKGEKRHS